MREEEGEERGLRERVFIKRGKGGGEGSRRGLYLEGESQSETRFWVIKDRGKKKRGLNWEGV